MAEIEQVDREAAAIEITDADREAFAVLDGWEPGDMGWRSIMEHRPDCHGSYVMAKHRTQARQQAIKEVAKAVEECGDSSWPYFIRNLALNTNHNTSEGV